MIKTDQSSGSPGRREASPRECWHSEPDTPCIRFDVDGRKVLLPYHQFSQAVLCSEGDQDELVLRFATAEVTVKGHGFEKLFLALQKQCVAWVQAFPGRQRSLEIASGLVLSVELRDISGDHDEAA